mmetsp:Transcript_57913/g.118523  ORF Transcript_57913/g.118523 Transcript_57913/m.118523 type:complete len:137 (-) Transcript_57913:93-503(-)|eukprot:CAMPEP_0181324870 /NCGR_PEP_ID=MMETSP1101-20121128/20603_1 /TAXON_ID=46948 /ORGANISM="Rhodomonas abbreviata, Strain Caron Lab Isolate" /LENGTH=136 /DNA_ID=CAMNT_0023433101 /DNA_START=8 /DNA_END=418 /DNA_ORIENTATION=+
MLTKALASLALIGSAAAFAPTMMVDRRSVVQAGAGAAAVTPFLQAGSASAIGPFRRDNDTPSTAEAPVITIFDHRGCPRAPREYKGSKAGGKDDEMMVKVATKRIVVEETMAAKMLQEFIGFEKGIDGDLTGRKPQ